MVSQVAPSFTTAGWISDPYAKADYIMASFFATEYSQTREWQGRLHSLPYIIQSASNDPSQLRNLTTNSLKELFDSYYDSSSVEVSVVDESADGGSEVRLNIIIRVVFVQNGIKMSLGRALNSVNGKLSSVTDLEKQ